MFLHRCRGYCLAFLIALAGCWAGCGHPPSSTSKVPPQTFPEVTRPAEVARPPEVLGPPTIPEGFVLRPTFETTLGTISAGTAFAVKHPDYDRPVILTAIHLLGPSGGLAKDVLGRDVPRVVKALSLKERWNASIVIAKPGAPIPITDAGPLGSPLKAGDVLAFWGPDGPSVQPAQLASANPAEGERVWLAASVLEGAPSSQRLHPATVTGTYDDGDLSYRFDNPKLSIRGTSGAPVLNAAGRVVAINLGGSKSGADMFGVGNPVERFRPHLEASLKRHAGQP